MRPLPAGGLLVVVLFAAPPIAAQPVRALFDAAVAAAPDDYAARRAAVLAAGPGVRPVLEGEATTGSTAVRRMIARALLQRLLDPRRVAVLDGWRMSANTARLRNPLLRAEAELRAAFRGEPALAYERLFAAGGAAWEIRALGSVVAAGGGDAFAAIGALVARHPALADALLRIDRAAAEDTLLHAIGSAADPADAAFLIAALGRAAGPRPGRALGVLRRAFATSRDDDVRRAAAEALGQRRDRSSVPALFASLVEPDQRDGQGGRREVTLRALGRILGAAGLDREILRRVTDPSPAVRRSAAFALGHRAPDASGQELRATLGRDGEALATLARDPDAGVRIAALGSLAWWAIRIEVRSAGGVVTALSRASAGHVLAATGDAAVEVRRHGLDALWRLAGAGLVARDLGARRSVARMALDDPDDGIRGFGRGVLDDFFDEPTCALVYALLEAVGRTPDDLYAPHWLARGRPLLHDSAALAHLRSWGVPEIDRLAAQATTAARPRP